MRYILSGFTGFMHRTTLPLLEKLNISVVQVSDEEAEDITEITVKCTTDEIKNVMAQLEDPDDEFGGYWSEDNIELGLLSEDNSNVGPL